MNFPFGFVRSTVPEIGPAAAQAKLEQDPKAFLLDVRDPDEYRSGHIRGATLIPLHELDKSGNALPRDREIICVCHSGSRSTLATRRLVSAGFQAVNLQGGMIGWMRAGLPVKKGME